jgi:hypothetical protein
MMTVASDVRSSAIAARMERRHLCVEKALFQLMKMNQTMMPEKRAP